MSEKNNDGIIIASYTPKKFDCIPTIKDLRCERLRKEAVEQKQLENEVQQHINIAENFIGQRDAESATSELTKILGKLNRVKDKSIRENYHRVQAQLNKLISELDKERLAKEAEERRHREEAERAKKQAEELARKEWERKEKEERKRREAEARRLAEEARKKEDAEQAERQRLESLSSELKENWQDFKRVLDENRVSYLYHFTDNRNIQSIKRHGGLLSWYYCRTHNIPIPYQGGDDVSMELDKKYGLQDYVRLSFCNEHPMKYRLEQSGCAIKVLRIKVDVALLKDTQFSDMNAADKRHTHGKQLENLQMVDFDATKMDYLRNDDPKFKLHQAEVMVKTFIPLKYIENI